MSTCQHSATTQIRNLNVNIPSTLSTFECSVVSRIGAGSVVVGTAPYQEASGGSIPTPALQSIQVQPLPALVARKVIVKEHYLHSWAGGTKLTFGVFVGSKVLGALTLGSGLPTPTSWWKVPRQRIA